VILLQHTLAIIHACFAQAFFALTVSLALFTSQEWRAQKPLLIDDGGGLRRLASITTALVYIQIVFGALLRHTGERLDGHLLFAALVAIHVVLLLLRISNHHGAELALVRPAYWLGGLLLVQLSLGTAAYLGKFTALLPLGGGALVLTATTHLIVGALMLATSLTITLRAFHHSHRRQSRQDRTLLTQQYSL